MTYKRYTTFILVVIKIFFNSRFLIFTTDIISELKKKSRTILFEHAATNDKTFITTTNLN